MLKRLRQWLAPVRIEEWALFCTWILGLILVASTGIDSSSYVPVFKQYLYFFAKYIVYLFVATRVLLFLDERYQFSHPIALRIKSWMFGPQSGYELDRYDRFVVRVPVPDVKRAGILKLDLEFLRLLVLLFANLTVYSNLKTHIPFINTMRGDEFFQQVDYAIFGESLILSIENWFANNPGVVEYFTNIYLHDYIWMVVLVFLLYLRRDIFALRWTVMSVCFVYIIGILMTVAYPSYGPCFVEPERFQWLHDDGQLMGKVQGSLSFFFNRSVDFVRNNGSFEARAFIGIAAFPSLHVAHMAIMLVVALRTVPLYALWMVWATTATFTATIGFGWHYVVDGIGGIMLAVAVTEGMYRLMRRWDQR